MYARKNSRFIESFSSLSRCVKRKSKMSALLLSEYFHPLELCQINYDPA